jgi:hypothetical protein
MTFKLSVGSNPVFRNFRAVKSIMNDGELISQLGGGGGADAIHNNVFHSQYSNNGVSARVYLQTKVIIDE